MYFSINIFEGGEERFAVLRAESPDDAIVKYFDFMDANPALDDGDLTLREIWNMDRYLKDEQREQISRFGMCLV